MASGCHAGIRRDNTGRYPSFTDKWATKILGFLALYLENRVGDGGEVDVVDVGDGAVRDGHDDRVPCCGVFR